MQGAERSEWLFHSQAPQRPAGSAPGVRRRRHFVVKPLLFVFVITGPAMHCAHGVAPQGLPLVVTRRLFGIIKPRDSRLALRAMHGRRTFVSY